MNKALSLWTIACMLLAVVILSPLGDFFGADLKMPSGWPIYSTLIVQAKTAINDGQFPLRVTPLDHQSLGYPVYQFYGPSVYSISGYVYKFLNYIGSVTHSGKFIFSDPMNTISLILFFALTFGGVYAYRFARLFTQSDLAAMLAATMYIFSPYLILVIDMLSDYPEAFSMALLPVALFYTARNMLSEHFKLPDFLLSTVAWFILLTSHVITFAYGSLFFLSMSFIFLIIRFCAFKGFLYSLMSIGLSYFLAAWFIVPVLLLSSHLHVSHWLFPVAQMKTTTLGNILALNNEGSSRGLPSFYASIGWPCLLGFLTCLYFVIYPKNTKRDLHYKLSLGMSILFIVAFIMAWSPINFWKFLPHDLAVGQYGHRFIAQIMWIGIIPFIFAMKNIFGEIKAQHFIAGVFLICLASASWLQVPGDVTSVSALLMNPRMIYPGGGQYDYLYLINKNSDNNALSRKLVPLSQTKPFCTRKGSDVQCNLRGKKNTLVQLSALYYPKLLDVFLDGKRVAYQESSYYVFNGPHSIYQHGWVPLPVVTIDLPRGIHHVEVKFTGIHWANDISIFSWILVFLLGLYSLAAYCWRKLKK